MIKKTKFLFEKDFKWASIVALTFIQILYYVLNHGNLKLANDWQSIEMTFNYMDLGFVRRGLIGTLAQKLSELLGLQYSYFFISYFELVSLIIFTVFVMVLLYCFLKKVNSENKRAAYVFCLFFVALGGISFYYLDWAEPDIYMIVLTLISALLIAKDKFLFLIPLNCGLCTMIHEGYPMMFFMIIFVLLFYRWLSDDRKIINKYFYVMLFSGLITTVLFVYFYFISEVKSSVTLESMYNRAAMLTEVDQKENIEYLFFNGKSPKYGFWVDGKPTWYFFKNIVNVFLSMMLYLPLLAALFISKIKVLKSCAEQKDKIKYFVCLFGFVLVVPLFVCHTDTGRWVHDFWLYEFILFAYMIISNDEKFISSISHFNSISYSNILMVFVPYYTLGFFMDKEAILFMTDHISERITDGIVFIIGSII